MTELNIFTRLPKQAATIKPCRISCIHLLRTNILRICLVITRPALCLVCMLFNGFDQKLSIGFIQRKHERKKKKTALLFTTWRFNHLGVIFYLNLVVCTMLSDWSSCVWIRVNAMGSGIRKGKRNGRMILFHHGDRNTEARLILLLLQ